MREPVDPLEALRPRDRLWLVELCRTLKVRPETWDRIPMVAAVVEVLAVEAEADRLQEATGCGRLPALEEATEALGLPLQTHRTRVNQARAYSLDPTRGARCLDSKLVAGRP